ncbi:HNH endonuclease [Leifsonia sp. ZF2019]|uniref:HNH endonuclease n=1 Tax=Leifsonia sp. ZF2019 TaxID=2781978 RepID=UPI001CBB0B8B|nr:HNH endonuclease signature motif containing protein [Leifsonia sp. ZF2019]UAJ80177.1 HNH endonuclease [Leifsonia sp. ZF2019]
MIGPKFAKPTPTEEARAYDAATFRDHGVCVRCLRVHPIWGVNRDHRKGRGVGGLTVVENLQLLCGSGTTGCHGWKSSHPAEALTSGYAVPGYADPLVWPARRWVTTVMGTVRQVWVLYRHDGTWDEITDKDAVWRMQGEA